MPEKPVMMEDDLEGFEEEMPEEEGEEHGMGGEGMGVEALASVSDEDLLAEMKKRGLSPSSLKPRKVPEETDSLNEELA